MLRHYNEVATEYGMVRVSPIEASILRGSLVFECKGYPPTPKAAAIMRNVERVAKWKAANGS